MAEYMYPGCQRAEDAFPPKDCKIGIIGYRELLHGFIEAFCFTNAGQGEDDESGFIIPKSLEPDKHFSKQAFCTLKGKLDSVIHSWPTEFDWLLEDDFRRIGHIIHYVVSGAGISFTDYRHGMHLEDELDDDALNAYVRTHCADEQIDKCRNSAKYDISYT